MKKNILAIMFGALLISCMYQTNAQHGLDKIEESYKKFLAHVVVDVIEELRDKKDIHDQFFAQINEELLAWIDFWKKEVKDFCKSNKNLSLKNTVANDLKPIILLLTDPSFCLSKKLQDDLGYDKDNPVVKKAFNSIAYTLRKQIILSSGYFLPPQTRKKKGIKGEHFDANLEICIRAFEETYSSFVEVLLKYILDDTYEDKSPDQMIEDFSKSFHIGQYEQTEKKRKKARSKSKR